MSKNFLAKKYQAEPEEDIFGSGGVTWDDVIYLNIGDPDILTPKVALQAAFEDAYNGYTKYTDTRGYPELRDEIRKFYKSRYNMDIKDEEICVTVSGQMAMWTALQAPVVAGDEVIIIEPYFSPYKVSVEMAGGVPVFVPTYMEEDFQINIDRLEKAVTSKTKGIIINTPSNPSGVSYSNETLKALANFAIKYDLLVYADDIYTSFDYVKPFVPIASLPGMFERTITVNSASKNFIMTGMRIGNVVAPEYIIAAVKLICESTTYSAPAISQRAVIHAFRHFEEFEADIVKTFKERADYAYERLSKMPFIDVLPVSGTFYIYPSVKKSGLTGAQFADKLFKECHVKVIPGIAFGDSGTYHFRISCTVSMENLKEAFDRMEKMTF